MIYLILFCYSWIFGLIIYNNYNYVRILNYFYLINIFLISFFILIIMNKSIFWYQLVYKFNTLNYIYISYIIGIDNISICLILLCAFIIVFCLLLYWYLNYQYTLYSFTLFFSLWILINIFGSIDLFFFLFFLKV